MLKSWIFFFFCSKKTCFCRQTQSASARLHPRHHSEVRLGSWPAGQNGSMTDSRIFPPSSFIPDFSASFPPLCSSRCLPSGSVPLITRATFYSFIQLLCILITELSSSSTARPCVFKLTLKLCLCENKSPEKGRAS